MDSPISEDETITLGKYIIIQRQNYTKLFKFNSLTSCTTLGKDQIEMANISNCKYYTNFKMIPKGKGKHKSFMLEVADSTVTGIKDALNVRESGKDNRDIVDDGRSQKLTTEEIISLRENTNSSTDILEKLITNSTTFNSKTEYSQEKYLKKKEKKYFEFLTIRKPTIRLIADIMYRQDSAKILGIRSDTLSQILTFANVSSAGNHLLYESGTSGLMPAAILCSIGSSTDNFLIHAHPGNSAQKQALLGMNYPDEQLNRCISVNIYSVLRHYYQDKNKNLELSKDVENSNGNNISDRKRKIDEIESDDIPSEKMIKLSEENNQNSLTNDDLCHESKITDKGYCPTWMLENEKACTILKKKVDSLIITCKEHPMSIFKALLPFVNNSRPFVLYSQFQEPLQECYIDMRKMSNVIGLKLTSSWTRGYQVFFLLHIAIDS